MKDVEMHFNNFQLNGQLNFLSNEPREMIDETNKEYSILGWRIPSRNCVRVLGTQRMFVSCIYCYFKIIKPLNYNLQVEN